MKPYTVSQINEYTWQIAEVYHTPAALPMFLFVGKERAALIDTGLGIGDLPGTIREITPLPVTVYNTHAHLDHIGGNSMFTDVYMHPAEIAAARKKISKEDRLEFIELKVMYDPLCEPLLEFAKKNMVEYDSGQPFGEIQEGEKIDLGGVSLDTINVKGHTEGSLVYVDRAGKVAVCGDAVNARSSIGLKGEFTVERYQHSLERLLSLTAEVERYYIGHRLFYFKQEDIQDIIHCAEEIAAGVSGEPYAMIVSRKGPIYGRIHYYNGKRIVFNDQYRR